MMGPSSTELATTGRPRPTIRFSVRSVMVGIAFVALGGTVIIQQKYLQAVQPTVDFALRVINEERETSRAARRAAALRSIFGDLGLAILRDGEKLESLRVVSTSTNKPPNVEQTGRVLGRSFIQKLGKIILDEADYEISADDLANPWTVGIRVWRRDECVEILYESASDSLLDVQVVVRDWRGEVIHDTGFYRQIYSPSFSAMIHEIEGREPSRAMNAGPTPRFPTDGSDPSWSDH